MNLRNTREIKRAAAERVRQSPAQQKIVMIYAGLALGLTALVAVLNYVLGLQMDHFGGLSNLGKRSMLSTLQSMLPFVQSLLSMCLNLGYVAAMLRIARGMYASPQTLRLGFDRFFLLIRCAIFQGLILSAVVFVCLYFGVMLFMVTPFSNEAVEIVTPLVSQTSMLDNSVVIDDATYALLMQALTPAFVFCGILFVFLGIPVIYNYRMVDYVIIDKPGTGALMALRESKRMMRGNRMALLKLDLSLWWYYLASGIATVICYGDALLPMVGVELPVSETVAYFVFYALYLLATFGIYVLLRNRAEAAYALAYDAVKPAESQESGVVLGNIFQM